MKELFNCKLSLYVIDNNRLDHPFMDDRERRQYVKEKLRRKKEKHYARK